MEYVLEAGEHIEGVWRREGLGRPLAYRPALDDLLPSCAGLFDIMTYKVCPAVEFGQYCQIQQEWEWRDGGCMRQASAGVCIQMCACVRRHKLSRPHSRFAFAKPRLPTCMGYD
jgi:hypothetical protein